MNKSLYTIAENVLIASKTYRLVLVPLSFRAEPGGPSLSFRAEPGGRSREICHGEFVDIALPGFYLRRPLSICDREDGKLTVVYKVVGEGTKALAGMLPGTELEVLTGLGNGFDPDACREEALLIGGGLGVPPLYLLAKELKARGKKVTAVLGFNKAEEIILADEFRAVCDEVLVSTVDGAVGVKGFVTDAIAAASPSYDFFYTCGPMVMMRLCAIRWKGPARPAWKSGWAAVQVSATAAASRRKTGPDVYVRMVRSSRRRNCYGKGPVCSPVRL